MGKDKLLASAGRGSTKPGQPLSISPASSSPLWTSGRCRNGTQSSLRPAFELPPSEEEAEAAMSILKQIFLSGVFCNAVQNGLSSLGKGAVDKVSISSETRETEEEQDSREPHLHGPKAMQLSSLKELQSQGQQNILKIFDLLRVNPSLQKIVVSLSSDKAIWEAVMKNEAVKEIKQSFLTEDGNNQYEFLNGVGDIVSIIVKWILENIKTKVMGLLVTITQLVNELFHTVDGHKGLDLLDDILRSLFMLSLMVTIVVVMKRIRSMSNSTH
ncbi:hypothetical protein Cni_G03229 [Canna indica]|uniref:Uncharacterized protein n=1 Tax=Canna indica TaxID=4628 RepID=A0AAQ3Q2W0_9LILI|nr:hypothetical protein Cni_G03229 [Canna indica]